MTVGAYFSLSSFIIILIFLYMFFSKKRVNNVETKIYSYILVLTSIGLLLEIITWLLFVYGINIESIFYKYLSKITSSYYMLWSGLFVLYIMNICGIDNKKQKKFKIISLITFLLILILPIDYITIHNTIIPQGFSIILTYIMCFIYTIIDIYLCIKYRKHIINSKFPPLYPPEAYTEQNNVHAFITDNEKQNNNNFEYNYNGNKPEQTSNNTQTALSNLFSGNSSNGLSALLPILLKFLNGSNLLSAMNENSNKITGENNENPLLNLLSLLGNKKNTSSSEIGEKEFPED